MRRLKFRSILRAPMDAALGTRSVGVACPIARAQPSEDAGTMRNGLDRLGACVLGNRWSWRGKIADDGQSGPLAHDSRRAGRSARRRVVGGCRAPGRRDHSDRQRRCFWFTRRRCWRSLCSQAGRQGWAAFLFIGVALFAGDMLSRAMLDDRLFTYAAPMGGVLMIVGWLAVALSGLLRRW